MEFSNLDQDEQIKIREFGESLYPDLDDNEDFPISLDELADLYYSQN